MKVLFFVPRRYSLFHRFRQVFTSRGCEVYPVDFFQYVKDWEKKVNVQIFRLPASLRLRWENYYFRRINQYYIEEYGRICPDLIFVYNNEMILPETLAYFRKRSKVAFFMGDHPFYTPTNRYYLSLLLNADAIFAPDTFWISQLSRMGARNIHFLNTGIPEEDYFPKELPAETYENLRSEVLYVGLNYSSSWGYRKAKFLSGFTGFGLQIHGNKHWKQWFAFFPELERCFRERRGYFPAERLNEMFNATRIVPVDGNPGLLHGVHLRMFEALGAGALPLLEWQPDLKKIFGEDAGLPAVKSYDEIPEMAGYYLNNETARQEKVAWMKGVVSEKYSVDKVGALIFDALKINANAGA